MPFGVTELLIVLAIILIVFGPKRLPMLGRQLGGGLREFKDSITRKVDDDDDEAAPNPARPELSRSREADVLGAHTDATPTQTPTGGRDESATRPGG